MSNKYTNQKGEVFVIEFLSSNVPVEADYWGYGYKVSNSKGLTKVFRILVRKSFQESENVASFFVRGGDPINELYMLLEDFDGSSTSMFFPDLSKGWCVF